MLKTYTIMFQSTTVELQDEAMITIPNQLVETLLNPSTFRDFRGNVLAWFIAYVQLSDEVSNPSTIEGNASIYRALDDFLSNAHVSIEAINNSANDELEGVTIPSYIVPVELSDFKLYQELRSCILSWFTAYTRLPVEFGNGAEIAEHAHCLQVLNDLLDHIH